MTRLYHFTCAHSVPFIQRTMTLEPHVQPQLDGHKLIWLTDLERPDRTDVGLTSVVLQCDRMEYRATVEADAYHWPEYLRGLPRAVRLNARALTDGAGLPMHWYVSEVPVPVLTLGRAA